MLNWFKRRRDRQDPSVRWENAGMLTVCSGTVLLGDPMFALDEVRLEGVPAGVHPVRAQVICYPEGGQRVAGLELVFSPVEAGTPELIGAIGVDSASVALVDAWVHEHFWRYEGETRIGVLSTPQHREVANLLHRRFGLRSEPVNAIRSELIDPVSHELEREIKDYLKTIPAFSERPFMFFRIETGDTSERLQNNLGAAGLWCDLVLDTRTKGNVLSFSSGFGDGSYSVFGCKSGDQWIKAAVEFIGPDQEKVLEAFPMLRY